MGYSYDNIWTILRGKHILILGLNGAGKSTILHNFQVGEFSATEPSPGFIVESVQHGITSFTSWAVGLHNSDDTRSEWRKYYENISGLVFVVDSTEVGRFDEARDELMKLLDEEDLRDIKVLILANKKDVKNAVKPEELELSFHNVIRKHQWHVHPTSGKMRDEAGSVIEGLKWLADAIRA